MAAETGFQSLVSGLGTLGTFEGSVARLLARKLRRISKELKATNQKVGYAEPSSAGRIAQTFTFTADYVSGWLRTLRWPITF
jgi:hypothetical protein